MDELTALVKETCQHPKGSIERQKGLHEIIWRIQQSGKLLWGKGIRDAEDAIQKTWLYFCLNLCEATTSEKPYDSEKGNVITWLNAYLRYRLKDNIIPDSDIEETDPTDFIPAPAQPPPILEEIEEWLQQQAHNLRRIYVTNRPDINCLVLIKRRLPPETSWKDLSQEFGVPIATLSGFYQRRCFPLLLNFGKSQGYFDDELP